MPKPRYPTDEGIWSKGKRPEQGFSRVRLGTPYQEAVAHFREAMQGREDFDPAVLFVWGTMQGKAVLNILKSVEEAFGEAGQEVVRKAINRAGSEALDGLLDDSSFPQDVEDIELLSYIVTGINTVLYASLEKPWIASADRCEFDILWCPHQDVYTAFDCRVQRYFVEGMIDALEKRGYTRFVPAVQKLIPHGAERCHFVVDRISGHHDKNPWHSYSEELARKALEKMRESK